MKLLTAIHKVLPHKSETEDSHLKLLYSNMHPETREEVVYRKNGKSVDRIIEFDPHTGSKIKTTHYDYLMIKKVAQLMNTTEKQVEKSVLSTMFYINL